MIVAGTLAELPGVGSGRARTLLPPPSTSAITEERRSPVVTDVDEPIRASAGASVAGALPDGTSFRVDLEGTGSEDRLALEGISAGIVMDLEDGSRPVVGITSFGIAAREGAVSFEAGDWIVGIDVYDDIKRLLGDGWASEIRSHVSAREVSGYPVLDMEAPFRFASDEELPLAMEVMYPDFVVRRGCGELALRCSTTGAVQLIPIEAGGAHESESPLGEAWIDSSAPRPADSYLDPGPLSARISPIVFWTGSEMMVYGGTTTGGLDLTDGALFDPESKTWRSMPEPPPGTGSTAGVWADDRLIVVSDESTVSFTAGSKTWEVVAEGAPNVTDVVFDGTRIVAWGSSMFVLHLDGTEWAPLDPPSSELEEIWQRVLRVVDGTVYAIGVEAPCRGQAVWRLEGASWVSIPSLSLATGEYAQCNVARDSMGVGGELLIWEDVAHPSAAYDQGSNRWVELDPPPIGGCNGGSQPLLVGERLLIQSCGDAAIFDPADRSWRRLALPGDLGYGGAVWTGSEVLAWPGSCCSDDVDAWRWTPPA